MNKSINSDGNNEIDLRDLLSALWLAKFFILFCVFISIALASLYLRNAEREYTVLYKLKAVSGSDDGPDLVNLGGIASLAGINLPSTGIEDFMIFKELIFSYEVAEKLFQNKELVKDLFIGEWDVSKNVYAQPQDQYVIAYLRKIKRFLTGDGKRVYNPPNPRRLLEMLKDSVVIFINKDTDFIHMKSESSNPELFKRLIVQAAEVGDKIMRERYMKFSSEPLAFYKEKLRTARSLEHREALAQLIGKEEQKLMLASSGAYFAAEPFIKPTISYLPTSPKWLLILAISLVLGFFSGASIVLLRNFKTKDIS